jgi:hypothetical protein
MFLGSANYIRKKINRKAWPGSIRTAQLCGARSDQLLPSFCRWIGSGTQFWFMNSGQIPIEEAPQWPSGLTLPARHRRSVTRCAHPTIENDAARLIQHQDQIGSAECAGFSQFEHKGLGLKHGHLGAREAASGFVRVYFRTVKDMKEVSHRLSIIRHVENASENHVINVRFVITVRSDASPRHFGRISRLRLLRA